MTIKEIIETFKKEKMAKTDSISIAYDLEAALMKGIPPFNTYEKVQWQTELSEVYDYYWAMRAFYDMMFYGIKINISAFLAFHFASRVIYDWMLPHSFHADAYCVRAMAIYRNNTKFFEIANEVYEQWYNGQLHRSIFFDAFFLGNVFLSEGSMTKGRIFQELNRHVPFIVSQYPELDRQFVMEEGGKEASTAFYDYISDQITRNPRFPVM
jgi:hypothetical protein